MKLIALAIALFSFASYAGKLDCREKIDGILFRYGIYFEDGVTTLNTVYGNYEAVSIYDPNYDSLTVTSETDDDVYEFSFLSSELSRPDRFFKVSLTTYQNGSRDILCRYKEQ